MTDPAPRKIVTPVVPGAVAVVRPVVPDPARPRLAKPYPRPTNPLFPRPTGRPAPRYDAERIARSTAAANVRFV